MAKSETHRQTLTLDGVELQLAHPDVFDTHEEDALFGVAEWVERVFGFDAIPG